MDKTERRQALLHAARDVFATKGYYATKVDDIVGRANVAKGTFYLYFRDKRSVFSELVDLVFSRLGAAILKVDPAADVDAQVKHNIRAIVAVLLDDPALTRILISYAPGTDPAFVAKIRSFYDGVKMLLSESLAEGQRLGIVAKGDPRLLATFTVGMLKELLAEKVDGDAPIAREQIVDSTFSFLRGGYLRTAGLVPPPSASANANANANANATKAKRLGRRRSATRKRR
jgi:AcrR family transcriptional regulator